MSEVGFTKGPWAVADVLYDDPHHDGYRWDVHIPGKQTVAEVDKEPDAHLIAAAPCMYDAILTAIAEIEMISPAVPSATARLDAAVDEMRRILSHARGEA